MSARKNKKNMTEERSILLLKCPKAWLLSQRSSNPFWRLAQIWITKPSSRLTGLPTNYGIDVPRFLLCVAMEQEDTTSPVAPDSSTFLNYVH